MDELIQLRELLDGKLAYPQALADLTAGMASDAAALLTVSDFILELQRLVHTAQDSADRAYMESAFA
jgi:hypothetical protein